MMKTKQIEPMRTTVNIEDSLLEEVKNTARRRNCSLGAVIEDAIRQTLLNRKGAPPRPSSSFPTYRGRGPRPGVQLDSNAQLEDLLNGDQ